jgi:Pectate lyase superfamily protein
MKNIFFIHFQKLLLFLFVITSSCSLSQETSQTQTLLNSKVTNDAKKSLNNNLLNYVSKKELFATLSEELGGVINVRDYGARGDGVTDDTQAFKKALERDEIANQGKIIYIPNGTYLVSDTIVWPKGSHSGLYYKRTTLLGESRKEVIIKLKDNSPGFSEEQRKPIIDTKHNRANGFRNTIENVTISTGSGNKSAIGLKFNSNNGGGIFNVSIIAGDGQGSHGLDLTGLELGPLLVKNVSVTGFDKGILVGGGKTNSVHMENIELKQQNELGIDQAMQVLTIRNLKSFNHVPVIHVRNHSATLTLLGAELEGINSSDITAIETKYREEGKSTPGEKKTINTFLLKIKQKGYQNTAQIYNCDTGNLEIIKDSIDEWSCGKPLRGFSAQTKILNLPVKDTPYLEHDLKSAVVAQGNSEVGIQAAIDTPGVKTVFLPNRSYQIRKPILIRGTVKKIIGMRAFFSKKSVDPMFRLENGQEPIVTLERLEEASIEHNSKRSLAIAHSALKSYTNTVAGTGDIFFEDIVLDRLRLYKQNAWARSLNIEAIPSDSEAKIMNNGGSLWILGLKTENPGTIIETKNNGSTEVLGGFNYINKNIPSTIPSQAQYINNNSKMSILTRSYLPTAIGYEVLMREIKDGVSKDIMNSNRRSETERLFPYLGY